jgi:hypothetical protein
VETGCWSSPPVRELRPGTPVIASHVGAGRGRFLVGVFTGERLDELPWPTGDKNAAHAPHAVTWVDAVFLGDEDVIPGATNRAFRWLTTAEFNVAPAELTVREDDEPLVAGS